VLGAIGFVPFYTSSLLKSFSFYRSFYLTQTGADTPAYGSDAQITAEASALPGGSRNISEKQIGGKK
jgi:hypothetical protein